MNSSREKEKAVNVLANNNHKCNNNGFLIILKYYINLNFSFIKSALIKK
jgi:hypothetical protein